MTRWFQTGCLAALFAVVAVFAATGYADTRQDLKELKREWRACVEAKNRDHEDCEEIWRRLIIVAYKQLEEWKDEYARKCSTPEEAETEFCRKLKEDIDELGRELGGSKHRLEHRMVAAVPTDQWNRALDELFPAGHDGGSASEHAVLGYRGLQQNDWTQSWLHFRALDESDQTEELLAWAEGLCEKHPTNAVAFLLKGDALARIGRYDEAVVALDRAQSLNPELLFAYDLKALILIVDGEAAKAQSELDDALERNPTSVNTLFERGMARFVGEDVDGAIVWHTRALDLDPTAFLASNARGVAYLLKNEFDRAFQDFDQALRVNPDFAEAEANLRTAALLRAQNAFGVREDLRKLAKISAKGPIGFTMLIDNPTSMPSSIDIATRSLFEQTGRTPIVTNDFDRAISMASPTQPVLYTREVASMNSLYSMPQIQPLARGIDYFNESVGLLAEISDYKMPAAMEVPLTFAAPLIVDFRNAREGQFHVLTSRSLERMGEYGISQIPNVVNGLKASGLISKNFNVSPLLAGAPDFAAGIGSQIGRWDLQPDIPEITHYLDGFNKAMWAMVGAMVAGPKGASIASTGAGLVADIARGISYPMFRNWAHDPVRQQMITDFEMQRDVAFSKGVQPKTFTGMYRQNLIDQVGFDPLKVMDLDNSVTWGHHSMTTGDISRPFPTSSFFGEKGVHLQYDYQDVVKGPTANLSFLQKDPRKTTTDVETPEDLSIPYLIFNP